MIFCGEEEGVRIEYLSEEGVEMLQELVFDFVDICDRRIANKEGGVVVVGPGMLNKKQARTNRNITILSNDCIKDSLEIVVAMVLQVCRIED